MMDKNIYLKRVDKFYRKSTSFYHTIWHIHNMFDLFEKYKNQFKEEFVLNNSNEIKACRVDDEILFWAIAYHDSFYVPGFKYNEEISANIAKEDLPNELSIYDKTLVINIIESTVVGFKEIDTPMKKILHDLDWSGFIDSNVLLKNESKILSEAVSISHYKAEDVIKNQIAFYKQFSQNDLYLTDTFKQFNDIAKENMINRIKEMESI